MKMPSDQGSKIEESKIPLSTIDERKVDSTSTNEKASQVREAGTLNSRDKEKSDQMRKISEVVNQRLEAGTLQEPDLFVVSKDISADTNVYPDELEMIPESRAKALMRILGSGAKDEVERLWSVAIIQTCDNIISAFAWGNAGILDNAFQVVFEYAATAGNIKLSLSQSNWMYFIIMSLFCWLFIEKFPYEWLFEDQGQTEHKKCSCCRCRGCCKRLGCNFAVEHTKDIGRAFFFLAVDTLAVVLSLAAREASMHSFAWMFNRDYYAGDFRASDEDNAADEASALLAVTLGYAILITSLIMVFLLKVGPTAKKEREKALKASQREINGEESSTDDLTEIPLMRFCQFWGGIVIAWAWRGYFQVFILLILDENESSAVLGYWIYSFMIASFVVILLSIFDLYQCVPTYEDLPFQSSSPERSYILEVLKASIVFVVALSFIESFTETFDSLSDSGSEITAQWIYCGLVGVIMIISNLYLEILIMGVGNLASGIVSGAGKAVNTVRGTERKEKITQRETFWRYLLKNVVYVLNTSVSVAAAFAVRDAVKIVLEEASERTNQYGEDETNWSRLIGGSWCACMAALTMSALATVYLTKVIKAAQTRSIGGTPAESYSHSFYEMHRSVSRYMANWD